MFFQDKLDLAQFTIWRRFVLTLSLKFDLINSEEFQNVVNNLTVAEVFISLFCFRSLGPFTGAVHYNRVCITFGFSDYSISYKE
ncbi:unnamed protein product [Protopolystoma xenopodis]|uniref:Uncharacterized protein n=1 Tax=Protopolystoma xenopodis TaxID=117903 RepID=A0A3S5AYH2_9PLAT|nr:unnamed protein product [Protopolystoma xenopodis]